jgi:hypothetical protein
MSIKLSYLASYNVEYDDLFNRVFLEKPSLLQLHAVSFRFRGDYSLIDSSKKESWKFIIQTETS